MPTPLLGHRASLRLRVFLRAALVGATTLAFLAGCASPRSPAHHKPRPRQTPLAAQTEFFDGTILAEAGVETFHVDPAFGRVPRSEEPGGPGPSDHGMGPPPGAHSQSGFGPRRGAPGGDKPALRRGAGLPEQTLRLRFTNRGPNAATITIAALDSLLGNFAPRPEKLLLEPGTSASLEPVSGDPGGLLRWLNVTVTLRREGVIETRVLHLAEVGVPPAPAD